MIPRQPGQVLTIGAETRRGIEVVASHQHLLHLVLPIKRKAHQRVDCLAAGNSVIFTHTDQAIVLPINHGISIAQILRWRNWSRSGSWIQAINPLIGII